MCLVSLPLPWCECACCISLGQSMFNCIFLVRSCPSMCSLTPLFLYIIPFLPFFFSSFSHQFSIFAFFPILPVLPAHLAHLAHQNRLTASRSLWSLPKKKHRNKTKCIINASSLAFFLLFFLLARVPVAAVAPLFLLSLPPGKPRLGGGMAVPGRY